MSDVRWLIWHAVAGLFRSRAALQAEILVLRHQLNVFFYRSCPRRVALSNVDRLVFVGLYRVAAAVLDALKIVQPETAIRWHHAGFRAYCRWRSRLGGGRPQISANIRRLILEMSIANPLWGAPRIHGELLKLGIDVGRTTVAKYMAKSRRPPSQGWTMFPPQKIDSSAIAIAGWASLSWTAALSGRVCSALLCDVPGDGILQREAVLLATSRLLGSTGRARSLFAATAPDLFLL